MRTTFVATIGALLLVQPVGANQSSPRVVRSFEQLDEAKTFEDLKNFGLTAPEERNHLSGTNLILLAVKVTAIGKGDWVKAIGLLGTEMIDVDLPTRLAYKSIFETGLNHKLAGITEHRASNNVHLLVDSPFLGSELKIGQHKSLIARREAAIYALMESLDSRYRYDSVGNAAPIFSPMASHRANAALKIAIEYALPVFETLSIRGYIDGTLKAAIGVSAASLRRDGAAFDTTPIVRAVGVGVSYSDALRAVIESELEQKALGRQFSDFLPELCLQLEVRDLLPSVDGFLIPDDEKSQKALLAVIGQDLAEAKTAKK